MATSTTEAEYVAAASGCGQVLWIQNQLLDYGSLNQDLLRWEFPGEGPGHPTEPHHTASPQAHSTIFKTYSHKTTTLTSSQEPTSQQISTPSHTPTPRRLTKRAIRIAQFKALTPGADEHASPPRDDSICDKLAAIGQPVDEMDKLHWFVCGLGASFETFSTAIRTTKPFTTFRDLLSQAESHEMFLKSLHGSATPPAAFFSQQSGSRSSQGRQQRQQNYSRGGGRASNSNGGRGRGGRRPPHCQLCRTNGHYASSCPSLHTYASNAATSDANLAQAFTSQCHVTQGHPDWYVDSGATAHMTSSPDNVSHSAPHSGNMRVFFGNGDALPVSHIGQSMVSNKILLRDVLVIPKLTKNLLSISKLTMDHPVDVLFSQPFFNIQDRETKQVIAQGLCEDGLYVLRDTPMALAATVGVSRKASFELWHNRLGHVSFDVISTLNKLGVLDVTSILPKPNICKPCQLSKSQRLPFELNSKRSSYPLDLIHCDLWGPAPVSSDGYLYYVIFVDDYSRFTWFYPLKTKSGFYTVLSAFIKLVQTQLSRKIKVFQSDGGTEFVNHTVRKIFEDNGTLHRLSCPYTPQQNGRAERKHRHLVETGLAMLFHAHVPASYWVDAFSSATYIINRLPTKLLGNHSPFELLYSRLPNYTNFRAFGCLVYPYLRDYSAHKLAPRSIPCVFIGYNPQYKGYKCLDPDSSRIYITRHARFDEVTFPFASTANPNALSTLQLCTFLEDGPPISDAPVPESRPTDTRPSSSSPCGLCPVPTTAAEPIHEPDSTPSSPYSSEDDNPPTDSDDVSSHGAPPAPPATAPTEPSSVHQMKTRSKSGIFKTKHSPDFVSLTSHALHAALFSLVQPKGFKSAAKHPQWMAAMHDEMEALKQNCTWTLVPRPSASNIVGSKWVYRIKYHADGSVERFKARVVAQGFTQIPGLDYSHTFSPVVKASTVRIVLSLAVLHRWRLHQLDVKNAFLHGHLNETVYMEQPPGFIDPQFPNHVCKLSKALYGLKQAPRAWFHRLSSFLLAHGFVCSRADTSLFVFTKDSCIMYLLFAIKDLGGLSYFLGLEVSYTNDGLFLSQAKYATYVLTRAALLDSKPVSTPLAANEVFVTGGSLFANPTLYRSLVGALQYLTITRPDLSYAVNQASQFLHAPTDAHFQSVKRILRYVKGTITYGLIFLRPRSNSILGYSDADWARCIETRRSTYGYSIFLGGNLVSWSAKKQPTVSRSSFESECRAIKNTAAEIVWVTHLLRELHALPPDRPTLLCDNKSALFMSQNPVSHKRAKHIDLDYHFVRKLVASVRDFSNLSEVSFKVVIVVTILLEVVKLASKWWPWVNSPSFSGRNVDLFESMLVPQGEGPVNPTEPHHTPSPQASFPQSQEPIPHKTTTLTSSQEPTSQQISTPSHTPTPRRLTKRAIRIAQSKALTPGADEPASPPRDDSHGEAFPTATSLDAGQDRENIPKTSAMPHESSPRVTSLGGDEGSLQLKLNELMDFCTKLQSQHSQMAAKIQSQDLEISQLKTRIKTLEDAQTTRGDVQEDAPNRGE
ncbi:retrovirus-related pol polyprotein from transposon TNT 1-94 [Tanacetum coccineum]